MDHVETRSDDLLTLREASKVTGRAVQTLRGWVRSGKLPSTRQAGPESNSRVLIRRGDLLGAMQAAGMIESDRPLSKPAPTHQHDQSAIDQLLAEKDARISELQADKSGLQSQVSRLERQLEAEREHSRELERQIANLQREVHSLGGTGRGIAGWLVSKVLR